MMKLGQYDWIFNSRGQILRPYTRFTRVYNKVICKYHMVQTTFHIKERELNVNGTAYY